jgi:hypothetical protein
MVRSIIMAESKTETKAETREAKAAEAQAAEDQARGYTAIEWQGQQGYQSLITGHTTFGADAEAEMIQYHGSLSQASIAVPIPDEQ